MRNALFFDIDGTLLSDVTGKIPDSALDALKKTIELGNLTFINTGRCYCSVPMELKRAPFSGYLQQDSEGICSLFCKNGHILLKKWKRGSIL